MDHGVAVRTDWPQIADGIDAVAAADGPKGRQVMNVNEAGQE